jgi:hypothetical protein
MNPREQGGISGWKVQVTAQGAVFGPWKVGPIVYQWAPEPAALQNSPPGFSIIASCSVNIVTPGLEDRTLLSLEQWKSQHLCKRPNMEPEKVGGSHPESWSLTSSNFWPVSATLLQEQPFPDSPGSPPTSCWVQTPARARP